MAWTYSALLTKNSRGMYPYFVPNLRVKAVFNVSCKSVIDILDGGGQEIFSITVVLGVFFES